MSQDGDVHDSHGAGQTGRVRPAASFPSLGRETRSPRLRVFRWVAAALAITLVVTSLAAYLMFRSVWDSILRVDVTGLGQRPPKLTNATNILVIGSDTRAGANRRFGNGITGQRSDTIMVLHIAPGNQGVIALSIPRDSVVPVLQCPAEDGSSGQLAQPGQIEQINATFAYGGPGCLWKTVEQTTHLHLDHFIDLNFTGFEKVIDDVGGVSICLPFPIDDPLSRLRLSAGRHHVYGAEALAFWRARYIGEGSDLQRIQRDQYLMASVLQGIWRQDLLASPARTISVITDAAQSMTTDSGLTLSAMLGIVDSLRGLPPGSVQLVELPTVAYKPNPNWVTWAASDTALFSAIAHDRGLAATHALTSSSHQPRHRSLSGAAAAAVGVRVRVLSGSGVVGIAQRAAADLASKGIQVTGTGDAPIFSYESSVIEYPSAAELRAATALKSLLGKATLRVNTALAAGTVQVIVGAEFTGGRTSLAAAAPKPKSPSLTQSYGGISGSANICSDGAAFTGPRGGA